MWTAFTPIQNIEALRPASELGPKKTGEPAAFQEALIRAGASLQEQQAQADHAVKQFISEEGSIHDTLVTLEKSEISMKFMVSVRNRLVDAYREVMRMS